MPSKKKSGYSEGAKKLLRKADKIIDKSYKTETRSQSMNRLGISTTLDRTGSGNRKISEAAAFERALRSAKRKK